ncbi:MAG: sulfotransferase family protein [Phycisphaerales bacterium JB038]
MHQTCSPHFFIVGADRSGTTLLRLMLNQHGELSVGPETWFFVDLAKRFGVERPLTPTELEEAQRLIVEHERFPEYPVSEAEFRAQVARLPQPKAGDVFAALPAVLAAREGKAYFGDKSPIYCHWTLPLSRAFPEAKFLHIIRDARDVALSLIRVRWYSDKPWRTAQHWVQRVRAAERARAVLGPERMIRLDYSDLVLSPESTLTRVCRFLDVDYDASMLRFYERSEENILESEKGFHQKTMRPPQASDVDVWKRRANRRLLLYVEGGAGRLMAKVGQEPALKGGWRLLARLAWGLASLRMHLLYPIRYRLILLTRGRSTP